MGTAHLAAIRPVRLPGAYTLDEHGSMYIFQSVRVLRNFLIEIQRQKDIGIFSIEILFRLGTVSATGYDSSAMFYLCLFALRIN